MAGVPARRSPEADLEVTDPVLLAETGSIRDR
jgi:hypothetical protein